MVPGVSPKATAGLTNSAGPVFINPAAFTFPPANAGRIGDSSVGSVVGPGTDSVSLSLIKSIKLTERLQFQFGAQAANAFNHRNFDVPDTTLDDLAFGTISGLQSAEERVHGTWRSRGGSASNAFLLWFGLLFCLKNKASWRAKETAGPSAPVGMTNLG